MAGEQRVADSTARGAQEGTDRLDIAEAVDALLKLDFPAFVTVVSQLTLFLIERHASSNIENEQGRVLLEAIRSELEKSNDSQENPTRLGKLCNEYEAFGKNKAGQVFVISNDLPMVPKLIDATGERRSSYAAAVLDTAEKYLCQYFPSSWEFFQCQFAENLAEFKANPHSDLRFERRWTLGTPETATSLPGITLTEREKSEKIEPISKPSVPLDEPTPISGKLQDLSLEKQDESGAGETKTVSGQVRDSVETTLADLAMQEKTVCLARDLALHLEVSKSNRRDGVVFKEILSQVQHLLSPFIDVNKSNSQVTDASDDELSLEKARKKEAVKAIIERNVELAKHELPFLLHILSGLDFTTAELAETRRMVSVLNALSTSADKGLFFNGDPVSLYCVPTSPHKRPGFHLRKRNDPERKVVYSLKPFPKLDLR